MLVAVCDHPLGTSTFSWRKIVLPFSLPIRATRRSHSTASNGEVRPSVKYRSNSSPVRTSTSAGAAVPVCRAVFSFIAIFVCDIFCLRAGRLPRAEGTILFYSRNVFSGSMRQPDSQQVTARSEFLGPGIQEYPSKKEKASLAHRLGRWQPLALRTPGRQRRSWGVKGSL